MKLKKHTAAALTCVMALGLMLTGCQENTSPLPTEEPLQTLTEPAVDPTATTPEQVEHLQMVVTEADFQALENYPNLKSLDLTGSTCYDAIDRYIKFHPDVEVTYTVSLGGAQLDPQVQELNLEPGQYEYQALMDNLDNLHQLKSLHISHVNFTAEELDALKQAYENLEITYSVMLFGQEYPSETDSLNLSALTSDQVTEAARVLTLLPNLATVELMDGDNTALSMQEVKVLVDAAPAADFHYSFSLFGKTISTNDKTVEYKGHTIGEEGLPRLREALAIMTGCESFRVIDCGLDNETLATLREEFPRANLAWKIKFGKYSAMTDTDTIRAVYNVFDDTVHDLRYCTKVKYIDMGHNESLTDLSFVSFMPDLEIFIGSGCAAKDLTGFESCTKLEFLELAYCYKLKDISALAGCESLSALNISFTGVTDLTALDGLPLERFVAKRTPVPGKEQKIFLDIHPDCWTHFGGSFPYGQGWRYDDNGKTYSEIYKKVREVFDLDSIPQSWIDAENEAKK